MAKISGTKEWAKHSLNIALGCEHDCRYCYARSAALRYGKVKSPEQWPLCTVNQKEVAKNRGKRNGTIMFPTSHDITPALLQPSIEVLTKLCNAGNNVLVVSKPHLQCVQQMCAALVAHNRAGTDRIFFRFTIGAVDNKVLKYWEPNAPTFEERLASLDWAFHAGFRTSVSIEPMLDSPNVYFIVDAVRHVVTDSIWIGKMNKVEQRVQVVTPEDEAFVLRIQKTQTDEDIFNIYNILKSDPLIRWKESIKSVVGLPLATEPGTDI